MQLTSCKKMQQTGLGDLTHSLRIWQGKPSFGENWCISKAMSAEHSAWRKKAGVLSEQARVMNSEAGASRRRQLGDAHLQRHDAAVGSVGEAARCGGRAPLPREAADGAVKQRLARGDA
jgi:hypothetical protein